MGQEKEYKQLVKSPYNTGIKNFAQVANYFQYYAPGIDSVHSSGAIAGERADEVFNEMVKKANMGKSCEVVKQIRTNAFQKLKLEGEKLDFDKPRMKFDHYARECNLHALLRHIRNALAHGRLYIVRGKDKGNEKILLEDYDNNKKKITAKIMVTLNILEQWRAILENEIATGE